MFFAWEFDMEEKWLNTMSAKGLQLCDVGYCRYVFEEGLPGEYVYRLELLDNIPKHAESIKYIQFIEDTGAEQIGTLYRWVYFRKKTGGNEFELFSNIDSRIKHLDRVLVLMGILSGVNLFNGVTQLLTWISQGISFNIAVSIFCLSVGVLIGHGFLRVFFKRCKLKQRGILHE
jgi:hypothetical protein